MKSSSQRIDCSNSNNLQAACSTHARSYFPFVFDASCKNFFSVEICLLFFASFISSTKVPKGSMQARLSEQLHLGECFTLLYNKILGFIVI